MRTPPPSPPAERAPAPRPKDAPKTPDATTSFAIEGMTCAACVGRVEKALAGVPGVEEATVNLVTERAAVRYDPAAVSPADLAEAVRKAGYDVRTESVQLAIGGMTCAACVRRVEKALLSVEGVLAATVNLATERAAVRYAYGVASVADLQAAARKAGYEVLDTGDTRGSAASASDAERDARERERLRLRR